MSDIPNFVKDAQAHSFRRISKVPKKITPMLLRSEIEMAQVIGEVSGAERILDLIINHKNDPNFSFDDLEAAIHVFLETGLNYVSKTYHGVQGFPLERVLKMHGYFEKKEKAHE
jgi:hypothetical protein